MSNDKITGCLLGGAMGDALGYPIEFLPQEDIIARHGREAPGVLLGGGLVSDDTQMTLFTAEGLLDVRDMADRDEVQAKLGLAYLRWWQAQTKRPAVAGRGACVGLAADTRMAASRVPGNTCMGALSALARGASYKLALNDSAGCGAVMRAAPCGLVAGSEEEAFSLGCLSGMITHGNPRGWLPAGALASMVYSLRNGASMIDAWLVADELIYETKISSIRKTDRDVVREFMSCGRLIGQTAKPDLCWMEQGVSKSPGWVGDECLAVAIAAAFWCERDRREMAEERAVRNALWAAACHSGDSDSTAAVAGNLIGVLVGAERLPPGWIEPLEVQDLCKNFGEALVVRSVLERG